MNNNVFVAYVGPPSLHDGKITGVRNGPGQVNVTVQSESGALLSIDFTGVHSVRSNRPVGMVLYALCEMAASGPRRRFVFANWGEEDDATLEVQANGFTVSAVSSPRADA